MFSIEFHLSYQDQTCYDVFGHDTIRQIESYSANSHTLDYMRTTFNHNAENASFEGEIVSRQGGAIISAVHNDRESYPYRWTPEGYALFVGELYRRRADYLVHHARQAKKYGADYGEPQPMRPVPRPIYFDSDLNRYQVEPWFDAAMRAKIINGAILAERMRAYDVIEGPRVGDWIETPDGDFRIAHRSGDTFQPTMYKGENDGFYLGGAISYSGSLGHTAPIKTLVNTGETRPGRVWFFSEDEVHAHNGVYMPADFRVYRFKDWSFSVEILQGFRNKEAACVVLQRAADYLLRTYPKNSTADMQAAETLDSIRDTMKGAQ